MDMITKFLLVLTAASALAGCMGEPTPQVVAAPRRALTEPEKIIIAQAVSRSMLDPESARFRFMPLVLLNRENGTDYCGLVNGKNAFGGYVGFQRFYARLGGNAAGQVVQAELQIISTEGDDPLSGVFQTCSQFGYSNMRDAIDWAPNAIKVGK